MLRQMKEQMQLQDPRRHPASVDERNFKKPRDCIVKMSTTGGKTASH